MTRKVILDAEAFTLERSNGFSEILGLVSGANFHSYRG